MMNLGLIGNPNSGKTSIFNSLTGLKLRTGNYPGITTEIKSANLTFGDQNVSLSDLPGAYSIYPTTSDERELENLLFDHKNELDGVIYVADINHLDKQLLLLSQLIDLKLPCSVVLNMVDKIAPEDAKKIQSIVEKTFSVPVHLHTTNQSDISGLRTFLEDSFLKQNSFSVKAYPEFFKQNGQSYQSYANELRTKLESKEKLEGQVHDTMDRYDKMSHIMAELNAIRSTEIEVSRNRADRWLTNPVLGPLFFIVILLFIFQAIYAWSAYPMDLIDRATASVQNWVLYLLGQSMFSDFLSNGVIAGIGGVVIFIPQIAILFLLIGILEQSGYMARIVFMFDHIMKFFGMSGRSLVGLMSAGACAIPAIMSARTIPSARERLITMLVSPFVSCAARIPVYTILIGIAIPPVTYFGFIGSQALVFTSLYAISILAALLAGLTIKLFFGRKKMDTALAIELPDYQWPIFASLMSTVWFKTKTFVIEAGKIILIISMVLWVLGSFGPGDAMKKAEMEAAEQIEKQKLTEEAKTQLISSKKLEASYAGHVGKFIEPVIKPLGYDWKIGIGLLASFAAREVFVGTMSTIYSLGDDSDEKRLMNKMKNEVNTNTGLKTFNLATSVSLLLFFLFSMQCMSTLAVMRKETGSWKWPLLQFLFMGGVAYLSAFIAYQSLSA